MLGRLFMSVEIYEPATIKKSMSLVIDRVLKITKNASDDDVSYLFECLNFLNSCVCNLDS